MKTSIKEVQSASLFPDVLLSLCNYSRRGFKHDLWWGKREEQGQTHKREASQRKLGSDDVPLMQTGSPSSRKWRATWSQSLHYGDNEGAHCSFPDLIIQFLLQWFEVISLAQRSLYIIRVPVLALHGWSLYFAEGAAEKDEPTFNPHTFPLLSPDHSKLSTISSKVFQWYWMVMVTHHQDL